MLGVNRDNREFVHGSMKVAWRRTLGWKRSCQQWAVSFQ